MLGVGGILVCTVVVKRYKAITIMVFSNNCLIPYNGQILKY